MKLIAIAVAFVLLSQRPDGSDAAPTLASDTQSGFECFEHPIDIVFIIDGSNSIKPESFELVKTYIAGLVELHDIGPEQTQIGVIQYGSRVRQEIALNQYDTNSEIVKAVGKIRHMRKGSMAGEALKFFVERTLKERDPVRASNPALLTKVIFITDGASQDYQRGTMTKYQALAKEQGVEMYAIGVGVGDERGLAELREIASDPDATHVFEVDDYAAIQQLNQIWDETKVCLEDECITGNNECAHTCVNLPREYRCECDEGYELAPDGHACNDVDECATDANACAQVCVNTEGSFYCECGEGFVIADDGLGCLDIDECATEANLCSQICVNTEGSFHCQCEEGYRLASDGYTCEDIDECVDGMSRCSQDCVNTPGSFYCQCFEGFQLAEDGFTCVDTDGCKSDDNNCDHICVDTEGSFYCACEEGYFLAPDGFTCLDVDECAAGTDMCSQKCINTEGSYLCDCDEGYALSEDGFTCVDIDECATEANLCSQICVNTEGSFYCQCEEGYRLAPDGYTCEDVNECNTILNLCAQVCVNTEGSFHCQCDVGYILAPDGFTCEDVDECELEGDRVCQDGCLNVPGGYQCLCGPGHVLADDRVTCIEIDDYDDNFSGSPPSDITDPEDVDECASERNTCEHECVNLPGGFRCRCPEGYELDQEDKVSCHDIDECADDSLNMCSSKCVNSPGSYECACGEGFELADDLRTCVDVDECESDVKSCEDMCLNTHGSFECYCSQGFVLAEDQYSCNDVDECAVDNGGCEHACVNTHGSYYCECDDGFLLTADKHFCSDIDECAKGEHRCTQKCLNVQGGVECGCDLGYELADDGYTCIDIDECSQAGLSSCSQICFNLIGSYECRCEEGFRLMPDAVTCKRHSITITVIEETTTTITVEWSKVAADGLQGYQLTYCKIPDEEDSADVGGCSSLRFDRRTTTAVLENLEANTKYSITIRAIYTTSSNTTESESTTTSSYEEATTIGRTKKLMPSITNLRVERITAEEDEGLTWKVTWEISEVLEEMMRKYENIKFYVVVYYKRDGNVTTIETNTTTVILTNLKFNEKYIITVEAVTESDSRTESIQTEFFTEGKTTACELDTGNGSSGESSGCSCSYYQQTQAQMQTSIADLSQQIATLTEGFEDALEKIKKLKKQNRRLKKGKRKGRRGKKQKKNNFSSRIVDIN